LRFCWYCHYCASAVEHAKSIVEHGTSVAEQRKVYDLARAAGESRLSALKQVVDFLVRTTES